MRISLIIPTYKRPKTLIGTLRSLQAQIFPGFEIIVVDNAADPELERIVQEFNKTARIPARYIPEPELGAHHARHAGARAARTEILAFTDDDMSFHPGWLKAYADSFAKHREMAAAGGPSRPVWEVSPPSWLVDLMAETKDFGPLSLMEPFEEFRLAPECCFWSLNMAIRTNVLFEVGGFNPDLCGDTYLGDGEDGLVRKLRKRRQLIGYIPDAIAYHHIHRSRMTVKYLCLRMANQGAADMYTRFHSGMDYPLGLFKCAMAIAFGNIKLWMSAVLLRGRTDIPSIRMQMHAARRCAELKYVLSLLLRRDARQLVIKKDWLTKPG